MEFRRVLFRAIERGPPRLGLRRGLVGTGAGRRADEAAQIVGVEPFGMEVAGDPQPLSARIEGERPRQVRIADLAAESLEPPDVALPGQPARDVVGRRLRGRQADDREQVRSEEHTSELQSLMRISYAVFCLKKKIKQNTKQDPLS